MQPFGSGLAQDLDEIRRLEEPDSSGELALIDNRLILGTRRGVGEKTYSLDVLRQAVPWLVDGGGKLATGCYNTLRGGSDSRIDLERLCELCLRSVLCAVVIGLVEGGEVDRGVSRTLAIDALDIINGNTDGGVQSTEGSEGHDISRRRAVRDRY